MNKYQKKISREAKRLQRDAPCSYKRGRIVARECYKFIEELKREEAKEKQRLSNLYK